MKHQVQKLQTGNKRSHLIFVIHMSTNPSSRAKLATGRSKLAKRVLKLSGNTTAGRKTRRKQADRGTNLCPTI